MNQRVLLTGGAGFIGGRVAQILNTKKIDYVSLVRPNSPSRKLHNLSKSKEMVQIDLSDIEKLKNYLMNEKFDVIIHIGALRGGRKYSQSAFYDTNVKATEQLAINALKNNSLLVFCSSVGVYGAIPEELPANINTEFNSDNYYHYTKITAEQIIGKYMLDGLRAVILRPSISYGEGDYGFPYTLTKLIHRKLMFLSDKTIWIHLANIEMVAEAFVKAFESEYHDKKIYNLADRYPIKLNELVDFISERLTGKSYPASRYISRDVFTKGEQLAERYRIENLQNRIRLISKSWFYDTTNTYNDLHLKQTKTIPDFKVVVDWYKKLKGLK